jgi:hypothetical protein
MTTGATKTGARMAVTKVAAVKAAGVRATAGMAAVMAKTRCWSPVPQPAATMPHSLPPPFMERLMKDAFVRAEMGMSVTGSQDASWLPPDYNGTTVPKVLFDLGHDPGAFGALAVGRDFQNGYRAELAFNVFGKSDFAGDWSSTEPATPGPHASVKGDTRSIALMLNGYYSPFEATQRSGRIKPFVTAGLGLAQQYPQAGNQLSVLRSGQRARRHHALARQRCGGRSCQVAEL